MPASCVLWQPRAESWTLTVVCKATYTLEAGQSPLAPDQEPVYQRDYYWDGDPARSLYAASDLALLKRASDVVLVGYAFAPGGRPVRSLLARLLVGEVNKVVEVVCDRSFDVQGVLREGPRFSRMSLGYERAAGGPETSNPVGMSAASRDEHGVTRVPNLQVPGTQVTSVADPLEPVGFGPIAPGWLARSDKVGPDAARWLARGAQGPMPDDLDRSYYQMAPPDQLTPELHANERIVLEHLHHEHARLVTSLPGVRPRAVVTGRPRGPAEIPMRADALWIDTGRRLCTLTWRGHLPLEKVTEPGRVIIATELPGATLSIDQIVRSGVPSPRGGFNDMTLRLEDGDAPPKDRGAALPFVAPASSGAAARPAPPAPPRLRPPPRPAELAAPALVSPPELPTGTVGQSIGMVLAAANAATAAAIAEVPPPPPPPPAPPAPPEPAPEVETSHEVLSLLWLDKASLPRIVRKPAWQRILDEVADEPVDPEEDDPAFDNAPGEIEDRATILAILDRGAASDAGGVFGALAKSTKKRAQRAPPLELVEGDLTLPFDAVETLKALVSAVTPLAAEDETLASALGRARDFLGSPGVLSAPETAAELSARIREVYRNGKRQVPAAGLDAQVERALLERRHYQTRHVLGGPHLRGLFVMAGAKQVLPVYLPAAITEELPLAASFRARLIVKVHLSVDEREEAPLALQAAGVGRVVRFPVVGDQASA